MYKERIRKVAVLKITSCKISQWKNVNRQIKKTERKNGSSRKEKMREKGRETTFQPFVKKASVNYKSETHVTAICSHTL